MNGVFEQGTAVQVTLPSKKLVYLNSDCKFIKIVEALKYEATLINYYGLCAPNTINQRAHEGEEWPIKINGQDIGYILDQVATDEEREAFIEHLNDLYNNPRDIKKDLKEECKRQGRSWFLRRFVRQK